MATRNFDELIQQHVRRDDLLLDETGNFREVKRAFVTAGAAGDTVIVAAVAARRIRVIALVLVAKAAVDVTMRSSAVAVSPVFGLAAGGSLVLPRNTLGWMEGSLGNSLDVNLSAIATVGVTVHYCELP